MFLLINYEYKGMFRHKLILSFGHKWKKIVHGWNAGMHEWGSFITLWHQTLINMLLRAFCCFLALALFSLSSFAQQRVVDQLRPRLDTLPESIEKVDVLLALARAYTYCGHSDKHFEALEAANGLSNRIGYKKGLGQALILQGIQEHNEGHVDKHFKTLLLVKDIAEGLGSKDLTLMYKYCLADWYSGSKLNHEKGIKILQEAIKKAGTETTKKNLGNAYRSLAYCYLEIGDTTLAMNTFHDALDIFNSYKNAPDIDPDLGKESAMTFDRGAMNIAQTHEDIAEFYVRTGNIDLALQYRMEALNIYEEWEATYFIGSALDEIGFLSYLQGNLEESLKYLRRAKNVFRILKDEYSEAMTNSLIGNVYAAVGDYEEAKKISTKVLEQFITWQDSVSIMDALQDLVNVELALGDLDAAASSSFSALEIAQALGDSLRIAKYAVNVGQVLAQKGNYESGLQYLKMSFSVFESNEFVLFLPQVLLDISNLFEQWEKPDSAIHYAQLAFGQAERSDIKQYTQDCFLQLSELHEQKDDFEEALSYHQQYFKLFEEMYSTNSQKLIKEEQVRQNVELYKKEKTTAEANAALLSQRNNLYIALGMTFFSLFLISGYLALRLRKSKKEIESQNQQLQELNQTKDKFFGIIAHDIRSPMVALQSVGQQMEFHLKKERFEKVKNLAKMVAQTTQHLDTLLDNLLNWALLQRGGMPYNPKTILLDEAVSEVSTLFAGSLESKNIQLKKKIPKGVKIEADERALQTTLRNLLSNAIKFTPEGGIVSIGAEAENGKVKVKVSDNGIGIEQSVLEKLFSLERKSNKGTAGEKGTGLGLILCKELVEMNKGELSVLSEVGKGASFEFFLPKN